MAGRTPTEWEPASPTPPPPAGASASDMATATTPDITHGGDQWVITGVAGIRTTAGARGAELLLPTSTASGATPHIHVRAQPGQIHIPAITEPPRGARTTTRRPDGPRSPDAVPTLTSIQAIPRAIAEAQPTTRILASLQVVGQVTPATSIPAKARRIAAVSSTTPTRMLASLPARTTSTPARMVPFIAITATAAVGPQTAATGGRTSIGPNPSSKTSSRCAIRVPSVT